MAVLEKLNHNYARVRIKSYLEIEGNLKGVEMLVILR